MVLKYPFFTLMIIAGMILLAILSTVLLAAWVLLTWGIVSAVGNAAVLDRLQAYRSHSGTGAHAIH